MSFTSSPPSPPSLPSLLLLLMKTFVLEDYGSLTKKKLMDCDGLEIQHPFTKVVTTYKFRTYLIRFNGIFGQWVYLNQQNIVLHIPN
ncbi:6516_t:CDS:2 [Rhizophagus irregularis]|nr:6516_t:CDS:2 [Rhizophagus irregularis]